MAETKVITQMKAARYDKYGGPEVLYEGTIPVPAHKPGKVLVRVHAASVNGIDLIVRAGTLRLLTGRAFPRGTGLDFAGEVAASGTEPPQFQVGDHVWGLMPHGKLGSIAEFVSVSPNQIARSPKGVDSIQAAALPDVGSTALIALRDIAKLKAGKKLLVRGASGGVGSVGVQLGREIGAVVTALAGASSLDFVRELGADRAFDYAATQPADLGSFDVIFDTVGSEGSVYRRLLAPSGRMIVICPDPKHPVASFLYILASVVFGARRVRFFSADPQTNVLAALASFVESGVIRPLVDTVYPVSGIADAHRAFAQGGRRGKQIIRLP